MKKLLFLFIFIIIISCKESKQDSIEFCKKAFDIYNSSSLDKKTKTDSALVLIDLAIEAGENNFNAYNQKTTYLVEKKDLKELIKNSDKLIELRPHQPNWLIQKGIYLELLGNKNKAFELYNKAFNKYQQLSKTDLNKDFNFRIEYLTCLQVLEFENKVKIEIEKLKKEFPNQKEFIDIYSDYDKRNMFEIWNNSNELEVSEKAEELLNL